MGRGETLELKEKEILVSIVTTSYNHGKFTEDTILSGKNQDYLNMIKDFGRSQGGVDYHETMGYNFKFTDLQAVIGIEQMKKLDWRVKRKKEMYKFYKDLLEGVEGVEFIDTNLEDTSPWFIDILVEKGEKERDKLASFLDERGIGTRPFYPAIHTQPPYSWVNGDFTNAEYISKRGLWLPSSSFLSDEDIERVCMELENYFIRSRTFGTTQEQNTKY